MRFRGWILIDDALSHSKINPRGLRLPAARPVLNHPMLIYVATADERNVKLIGSALFLKKDSPELHMPKRRS